MRGKAMKKRASRKRGEITVLGRHWASSSRVSLTVQEGQSLENIITDSVKILRANQAITPAYAEYLKKHCVCRVDFINIPKEKWAVTYPADGQRVEFFIKPGKGGGKNPFATILNIVVAVAAIAVPVLAPASWGLMTAAGALTWTGAAVSFGILTVGSLAVNMLCPPATPKLSGPKSSEKESPTYSISGARNGANPYGFVPLIFGRNKVTPPLAAKSWTNIESDKTYFNMCVIWGHPDMSVRDFKIGDTPLENFKNIDHRFHPSTTGEGLVYFGKSFNEETVGTLISKEAGYITRTMGECDTISLDITFSKGLTSINEKNGDNYDRTVEFEAEYKLKNDTVWKGLVGGSFPIRGTSIELKRKTGFYLNAGRNSIVYSDFSGNINMADGETAPVNTVPLAKVILVSTPHYEFDDDGRQRVTYTYSYTCEDLRVSSVSGAAPYINEVKHYTKKCGYGLGSPYWSYTCVEVYDYSTYEIVIPDQYVNGINKFAISGQQLKPLTRTYTVNVPHGDYDVRIRRLTDDNSNKYIYDEATWATKRAIVNRQSFSTPVPVCVSELRIQASEQLSGYVDNFNAICTALIPDFNTSNNTWEWRETRNPASAYRYVLTSRHALNSPYTEDKLDEPTLREFHKYCTRMGWTFDFVCDTEENLWSRLTQIAAAARASVTTEIDGKYGVVIDDKNKTPVQQFNQRNSWGFSMEKLFPNVPHALRIKFVNSENNFLQSEDFCYADGFDKNNATDIQEIDFPGITTWTNNWKQGRYHLASQLLRPLSVTINADWEHRMCHRGDVIEIFHDVLMNTFGAARVVGLIYQDTEGTEYIIYENSERPIDTPAVGVVLDDSIVFSERDVIYGIAIRNPYGKTVTYQIQPQFGEERSHIYFTFAITYATTPYIGDLASVSLMGEANDKYLVTQIAPAENSSAEIKAIPYSPEVLDADKGEIPPWNPPIIIDKLPTYTIPNPTITQIISDESMLVKIGQNIIPQVGIWFKVGDGTSLDCVVYARAKKTQEAAWGNTVRTSVSEGYVVISNMESGELYDLSIQVTDPVRGISSDWITQTGYFVIGKTAPPPDVDGVTAELLPPSGVKISWNPVATLDIDYYAVQGGITGKTIDTSIILPVPNKFGTLNMTVSAVDTLGNFSLQPAPVSVTIQKPKNPVIKTEVTIDGLKLSWTDCTTSWPIKNYEVHDEYMSRTEFSNVTSIYVSPRPVGNYKFTVKAIDIFGNESGTVPAFIEVDLLGRVQPTARIDGADILLEWPITPSAFPIDEFEIVEGDFTPVGRAKVNYFRVPAGAVGFHEWKIRARDIVGNYGDWGEVSIEIKPAGAPTVKAIIQEDKILISWVAPSTISLPITEYEIENSTTGESFGRINATQIVVPPEKTGNHIFRVRSWDTGGNAGAWGEMSFRVEAPGRVYITPTVIDNNALLVWTEPSTVFFPIHHYEVLRGDELEYAELIFNVNALIVNIFEAVSGNYTYWVVPVDVAGNKGTATPITCVISQPPDYVLFYDWDSVFSGTRHNFVLDGIGGMIGPIVDENETWTQNIARFGGTTADSTWKNKVDIAGPTWMEPAGTEGWYQEEFDYGQIMQSIRLVVTPTVQILSGTPLYYVKVEFKVDVNDPWELAAENATQMFLQRFRYIRFTLGMLPDSTGLIRVSELNLKFDVKLRNDSGVALAEANTNGPEWPGNANDTGNLVNFSMPYLDVWEVTAAPESEDAGLVALVSFQDIPSPKFFRVSLFNNKGERTTGNVVWRAVGI